ncbi:MAG: SIR2 family protein, partial [Oscillospiraceae bacterium]|nr:SIR2 family protein [Oscillospiraceae bacterium]
MDFQELMDCFFISKEDNNQVAYNDLLDSFKKQNVTPIIGAGLSCWAYPLWSKMLEEQSQKYGLETEVNELINENKYEDAASILEEEVTKHGFSRLLQKIFNKHLIEEKKEKRPDYLMKLPTLFHGPIVTTNFDRVIEHLFEICKTSAPDMVIPSDDFQSEKIITALHQNNPILVKMHGDIEDPSHLVLTKESYDYTYGDDPLNPNLKLPMPNFLQKVLERNPVLFLGCSLNADRTCTVIEACAQSVQQFAFLELPKETENKSDPLHPILKADNGKFLESFKERRKRITGDLNIIPIWYPYGMHEEALNAFITKLCEDINTTPPSSSGRSIADDIKYYPLHKLLGRDDVVKEIVEVLSVDDIYCVWVDGPAGIGKTETCKAVHSVLTNKFSSLNMPYIDVTGISGLSGFFTSVAKGINAQISNSVTINDVPEYLIDCIKHKFSAGSSESLPHIMYFDNWEDIWYGLNDPNEKDILVQWMMKLHLNKIHTLISSREIAQTIPNSKSFHIYPLDDDIQDKFGLSNEEFNMMDSVKLFCDILGRDILPSEYKDFRTLICNLEGHPLSIVLTATQARSEINISNVLKHWDKAKQDTTSTNKKHTNLEIALQMSWNSVSRNRDAVIQWGLEYYSLNEIPTFIFQNLCGNSSKDEWNEGIRTLIGANLVYVTQNRDAITMLLPLKKQFSALNKDKVINEICLIRWAEYIEKILSTANDRQSDNQLNMHHAVMDLIPQIFFIIEQLLIFETEQLHNHLNTIVFGMKNYYKFHLQSEDVLKKLIQFYTKNKNSSLTADMLLKYGDLLRRLGDVDGAQEAYNKAEQLYI